VKESHHGRDSIFIATSEKDDCFCGREGRRDYKKGPDCCQKEKTDNSGPKNYMFKV